MKNVIIDTDAGGDPDDLLAILLAINSPEIKVSLIVTNDEHKTDRAKFVINFLELLSRKIPVVSGVDLGNKRCFVVSNLIQKEKFEHANFLKTVADIIAKSPTTYYACIGPQSNLHKLISKHPELKERTKIVIMGGRINYENSQKIEHNFRYDIEAAKNIFNSSWDKKYILSDTTRNNKLRITENSEFYQKVAKSKTKHLQFLKKSIDCWFDKIYPESYMHDPLTISSLFNEEVVVFEKKKISLQEDGKMVFDNDGKPTFISTDANYELFWKMFESRILI